MEQLNNAAEKAGEDLRGAVVESLVAAVESGNLERAREYLWDALSAFAGEPFKTAKGLSYAYFVRGNELFFTRKEKSVTRASVNRAFDVALRLQREGVAVTGPKMLGCFGASYLYPVFIRIGVVRGGDAALAVEDERE